MSALGQKRTCAAQKVMSALPLKADMCSALRDVRFVPIADIPPLIRSRLQARNAPSHSRARLVPAARAIHNLYDRKHDWNLYKNTDHGR